MPQQEVVAPEVKSQKKTVSTLYIQLLKQLLVSQGYELRVAPNSDYKSGDSERFISARVFYETLETLLPEDDQHLGFAYGNALSLAGWDNFGQLVMSCRNLGHSFQYVQKYRKLVGLNFDMELMQDSRFGCLRLGQVYSPYLSLHAQRFLSEALYVCLQKHASWLTGKDLNYLRLSFPFPKPKNHEHYQRILGCELKFSQSHHEMLFERSYLALPFVSANQEFEKIKRTQCEQWLSKVRNKEDIVVQVRDLLYDKVPNMPTLEEVAKQLNTSKSSLHRKFQESDICYQSMVDGFRYEYAEKLLLTTRQAISDIADELGFSDASSFRRAFKRWSGKCPSSLRDRT